MRYDPKKPVDINNPLPQSRWPYKKGQKVHVLTRLGIKRGVVTFFQPALHSSCVVSRGHPTMTVIPLGWPTSEVVSVDDVRPDTLKGHGELLCRIRDQLEARAVDAKRRASEAEAAALEAGEEAKRYWRKHGACRD